MFLKLTLWEYGLQSPLKGDNKMIPGTVHISPGIYLVAEENIVYKIIYLFGGAMGCQKKKKPTLASVVVPQCYPCKPQRHLWVPFIMSPKLIAYSGVNWVVNGDNASSESVGGKYFTNL